MQVKIESLAFGGEGVCRVEGTVCFIEGALPGEVVDIDIYQEKKNYKRGRVSEIKEESNYRIEPVCQVFGECGGCQLQNLEYKRQVYWKEKQISQILSRIGGFKDVRLNPIIKSPLEVGYRNSVTVHRSHNNPRVIGFFANDNVTLISLMSCPIADDNINKNLLSIFDEIRKKKTGKYHITIRTDSSGNIDWTGSKEEVILKESILGKEISFSSDTFFQANAGMIEQLVKTVEKFVIGRKRSLKDAVLFDLYCGVGLFSNIMADRFKSVYGIERDKESVRFANSNRKNFNLDNVFFFRGEVENTFYKIFSRYKSETNVLILDPPRTGVEKRFLEKLASKDDVSSIVYISCNPPIFARDMRILCQNGKWNLQEITPLDMFPQTKHIELVAKISKST